MAGGGGLAAGHVLGRNGKQFMPDFKILAKNKRRNGESRLETFGIILLLCARGVIQGASYINNHVQNGMPGGKVWVRTPCGVDL